jgi:hypothetical protein
MESSFGVILVQTAPRHKPEAAPGGRAGYTVNRLSTPLSPP